MLRRTDNCQLSSPANQSLPSVPNLFRLGLHLQIALLTLLLMGGASRLLAEEVNWGDLSQGLEEAKLNSSIVVLLHLPAGAQQEADAYFASEIYKKAKVDSLLEKCSLIKTGLADESRLLPLVGAANSKLGLWILNSELRPLARWRGELPKAKLLKKALRRSLMAQDSYNKFLKSTKKVLEKAALAEGLKKYRQSVQLLLEIFALRLPGTSELQKESIELKAKLLTEMHRQLNEIGGKVNRLGNLDGILLYAKVLREFPFPKAEKLIRRKITELSRRP